MPLVQRILFAIRTLTEDEPPHPRRNRDGQRPSRRNSSKRQQAANLVITFRDLFASGGLSNFLLDDEVINHNMSRKDKRNPSSQSKTNEETPNFEKSNANLEHTKQCVVDLPGDDCKRPSSNFSTAPLRRESAVVLLQEERVIRSPELALPLSIDSGSSRVAESSELEVFSRIGRNKRRKAVTVSLSPDDENKTVAALRKVLKWSPRKQSMATFAVTLPPKDDAHKAVAVVQNAVNRVKEEQQKKKKRKLKLLKLTFC